jgi:hypothetical protein
MITKIDSTILHAVNWLTTFANLIYELSVRKKIDSNWQNANNWGTERFNWVLFNLRTIEESRAF